MASSSGERALLWQNSKTRLNYDIHVANRSTQIKVFIFGTITKFFTSESRAETCPIIEPKKLYISWKQCTWVIKASDSLPQSKFPAKREAVFYPSKEKRTKWPLSCVIAHNEKLAVVVATTGTGTICSLSDITSASFLYNVYTYCNMAAFSPKKRNSTSIFTVVAWLFPDSSTHL